MWNWWINNLQMWKGNFLLPHCILVFLWNWCFHWNLKISKYYLWNDTRAWHLAKPYELTHAMLIPNQFFSIRYAGWAELGRRSRHRLHLPTHVFGILYSKNFKILSIFSITKNFPFTVGYQSKNCFRPPWRYELKNSSEIYD